MGMDALPLRLAIADCAVQLPLDTASVPIGAFRTVDNDVRASKQNGGVAVEVCASATVVVARAQVV
jgi:hypothetical protein